MHFEQDEEAQCMMHILLECNADQYFQYMTSRGFRLPPNYDIHQLIQEREPTEVENLRNALQATQKDVQKLRLELEPPKTSFVESICALHFDRSLYMVPFPQDIEVPKYYKYDGNSDPHDHVQHFYALSMDFIHEDTYLLQLFPRSLREQSLEWFTNLSPPLKTFNDLVRRFT